MKKNLTDQLASLLQDWLTGFEDTLEGGDDEIVTFTREALADYEAEKAQRKD